MAISPLRSPGRVVLSARVILGGLLVIGEEP